MPPDVKWRNANVQTLPLAPKGEGDAKGTEYIDADDTVPIDFEKLPSGYYRVIPKRRLPKGEYGFLREGAGRVYDFGRE